MSDLDYAGLLLERKEQEPQAKEIAQAIVLAKNSRGLYLDINKAVEGYVSRQELGKRSIEDYKIGEVIEVYISSAKNADGVFKLSIKEIETKRHWETLESLKDKNLELTITKVVKSGVEVTIQLTQQTGFIPFRYLDAQYGILSDKDKDKNEWLNVNIPGRIHEVDQAKNKIILNNRVISEEQRKAKAEETLTKLSLGQLITGKVVRTTDFGVFVDIGGIDALIPASELSWQRFKHPNDVVKIGQEIEAKVFRVDAAVQKVGLSIKQVKADPWTSISKEVSIGDNVTGTVVTHADFGAFLEVAPGIEALLHKSNLNGEELPAVGSKLTASVISLDPNNKRMGISIKKEADEVKQSKSNQEENLSSTPQEKKVETLKQAANELAEKNKQEDSDEKELEHV